MKKENLWKQLYEISPKENVESVREWAEKYKPTLQWALPVVTIYGAYRILNAKNSALTVENIGREAKKKLGFTLKELNNKSALKELMVLGGLSAGAYAAIKAASAIYGKDVKELEVEQIEEGMEALDGARKKFGFIQPKTEAMFPIAVSVIIVYVMTQRPEWFEKVEEKVGQLTENLSVRMHVYFEMVKLFAMDKLHVNLNDEKEAKKAKRFMFLAAIVGICVILYGRKVLVAKKKEERDEEVNSRVSELVSQLISVMKQLMPTAISGIATFLVTKKLIGEDDIVDTEFWEEESEEEDSGEKSEKAKEDASSEKDSEEDSKE